MTQAQVKFRPLTPQEKAQVDPKGVILGKTDLPLEDILIEPSSQYIDPTAQSAIDNKSVASATTEVKATATKNQDDQRFIHKKEDNYVVLRL